MRSVLMMSLALSFVLFSTTQASASTAGIDLQIFQTSPSSTGFFTAESGKVSPHLALNVGFNLNYGHNLLQVELISPGGQTLSGGAVVANRLDFDVLANIGLFNIVDLGVVIPLVSQGGFAGNELSAGINDLTSTLGATSLKSFVFGDVRLVPKVQLVNVDDGLFAMALLLTTIIPTGGGAAYSSESSVVPQPALAFSTQVGNFRAALDLGARFRFNPTVIGQEPNSPVGAYFGDEYYAKAGVGFLFNADGKVPVELIGEAFGDTQIKYPFGLNTVPPMTTYQKAGTPAEGDVGLRIYAENVIITVGAGGGLRPGYGAPLPRAFASVSYDSSRTKLPDADEDGVPDERDKCPDKPEDRDQFQDDDGCPEIDNDKDNILDEDDQCPNDPEDKDLFQDEDGCPDPDNDMDGILDPNDKCPQDREDMDGWQDDDGCPDPDNDNDQILDALDQCPNEPEDLDQFEDLDGCPEPDNDRDGLADLNDQCPNIAEDLDGVADDDGCPEDNDGDGIPDDKDKCPNQAETYNGIKDEDGCPDALEKKSLVEVTEDKIEIKEAVYFKAGSSTIDKRSFEMLNQVAAVLKNYKTIQKLRVEGHTDNAGARAKNLKLSQDRAESVRRYLIEKGISGDRLQAKGFGPDKPIASNKTPAGKEKNRRVEFVIESRKQLGEEVKQAAPPPSLPPAAGAEPPMEMPGFDQSPGDGSAPPADGSAPAAPPPGAAPGGDLFDINSGGGAGQTAPDKGGKAGKKKKAKKKKGEAIQFGF